MRCIGLLILLSYISATRGSPNASSFTVGTVLFSPADITRECWSQENVALLTSRMLMSNLMPRTDKLKADDDSFITDIIEYFRLLLEVIRVNTNGKTKHIMLMAATDTIGGYMKHLVLPISKYSYYAGNVQYGSIIRLYQLYDELKNYLRTNGNGWSKPWKQAGKHIQAKSIAIQTPTPTTDPCKGLIYLKNCQGSSQDTKEKVCRIDVPLPFFDSKSHPAAVAVPFRAFGLRNLESRVSAYILVKYFVAVSKCMTVRNTLEEDIEKFNNGLFSFIASKVMPHLGDEKFYAAFGGVLRILQTVSELAKAKGHDIGNINIMPEIEDREPPDLMEDEQIATAKKHTEHTSRNLLILLILFLILMLLICCILYCCYRIKNRKREYHTTSEDACKESTCPVFTDSKLSKPPYSDDSDTRDTKTKIIFTQKQSKQIKGLQNKNVQSKFSKRSIKSSKSSGSKSSKTTHSMGTTPLEDEDTDTHTHSMMSRTTSRSFITTYPDGLNATSHDSRTPAPVQETRAPLYEPIREASSHDSRVPSYEMRSPPQAPIPRIESNNKKGTESPQSIPPQVETPPTESQIASIPTTVDRASSTTTSTKEVQYYSPTFACHTSMTGKVKKDKDVSTDNSESNRPYVFGYDFQTTSESSPRGDISTDGDTELGGNRSK